jgi:hypothetical protein
MKNFNNSHQGQFYSSLRVPVGEFSEIDKEIAMRKFKQALLKAGVIASGAVAGVANAAVDTTAAEASIAEFAVTVGVLGGAFLLVTIAKKAWGKLGG